MAGWTDYNPSWDTVDDLRLGDDSLFDACVAALNERRTAAGLSNLSFSRLSTRKANWDSLLSTLSSTISRYANHTDSSGNWNNQTNIGSHLGHL
jgi:hypothetical protein